MPQVAKDSPLSWALKQGISVASCIAIVLVARTSLADHYVVPTGSMLPTIALDDRIVVDKRAYGIRNPFAEGYLVPLSDPKPGDVVILGIADEPKTLIKRVVAGPGMVVSVRNGQLTISGRKAPIVRDAFGEHELLGGKDHLIRRIPAGGPDFGPVTLPDGEFLVMGDNRGSSKDGRFFGFIKRDAIRGRAVGVWLRHGAIGWHPL